jgi:membrane protein
VGLGDAAGGVRAFFTERVWRVRLDELPPLRAASYRAGRLAYSTFRGFLDNALTTRAASLTYFGVLSVVPFLAFAFALLKGFGVYERFIESTVRPYVRDTFAPNPALHGAIDRILGFVEATDVSRLGTFALLFLLYTSVTLVANVEGALNDVFGARSRRSLLRQLTDYTTLLVIAPILVVVSTTLAAAAQSSAFVDFLRSELALGIVIDLVVSVMPTVAVGLALFAVYAILPNVRVRPASALVGAAVAALLWQGALTLHVQSQLGVARYNALYSGLAAIPIFLVWTYVSWLVVLVGAQLAASHQNEQAVRQRFRVRHADEALKEMLAVAIGAVITRDFLARRPGPAIRSLAEVFEVSPGLVEDVMEALLRGGVVLRTASGGETRFAPGGDVDLLGADDLREAVRRDPAARELRGAVADRLGPRLARVLRAVEAGPRGPGLTLRGLAECLDDGRAGPRQPGAPLPLREAADGDAKQPDVP